MRYIKDYYERSPSSGLWFCEYGEKLVGLVAVDASDPDHDWQPGKLLTRTQRAKDVAAVAVIRHFYILEKYRPVQIQDDLLAHAVKAAFEGSTTVERIEVTPPVLSTYVDNSMRKLGFVVKERTAQLGILKWPQLKYELTREAWEKKKQ